MLDTLEPKSELSSSCQDWCASIGSKAKTVDEAITDEAVRRAIQEGLDRANQQAISNAQRVQKFLLLNTGDNYSFFACSHINYLNTSYSIVPDFSVPGGELGPTLKLKRHYVMKKYDIQINNFYNV